MALQKNVRLTVIEKIPYNITGDDGKEHKGYLIKGFDSTDTVHSFTSQRGEIQVCNASGYDPENIQAFELGGREWKGKTKWRELE